ncbi:peptidase [Pectobacterium parvum]|uniref:Peptidase n=3 Tax=Pectobacteriaceae TaxID=1903410 RepID=A0AAP9IJ58_9GAMM|nr:peptidase [Pectobacterium parvum]TAI96497.1 peptidase [Pectobacterium versatile]
MSLCLMVLLCRCSTTRTVYVPMACVPLPANLTTPTAIPMPPSAVVNNRLTYGQSVNWNSLLLAALESANNDKALIRQAEQQREQQHAKSGTAEKNH